MKQPLIEAYPKAYFQRRLVYVMRNICVKVRVDDREAAMNNFKQVHQQANKTEAVKILHNFYAKWGRASYQRFKGNRIRYACIL